MEREKEHEKIAAVENVNPPPYYPDHPIVRKEWARYLNSVSGMDKTIGKVLRQLKKDGLAENTIVIFWRQWKNRASWNSLVLRYRFACSYDYKMA